MLSVSQSANSANQGGFSSAMPSTPDKVVLHPLVLLSVVDNYNRVARDTKKRVVGILLGEVSKGTVDVTNSFAGAPCHAGLRGACNCVRWASGSHAYPVGAQCRSRRTMATARSGSWITATLRLCTRCSRKSMVSLIGVRLRMSGELKSHGRQCERAS